MFQHPVPEKLLVQIGDMTVSFALVEQELKGLVGAMIAEHQRVGQIITAELSFRALRALLLSLYKERHGEDQDFDTLLGLIRKAGRLEDERNAITHSVWAAGDIAGSAVRVKATAKEKKGLRFDFTHVTEADLALLAAELRHLAGDLLQFRIDLIEAGKAINNPTEKFWPSGTQTPL